MVEEGKGDDGVGGVDGGQKREDERKRTGGLAAPEADLSGLRTQASLLPVKRVPMRTSSLLIT